MAFKVKAGSPFQVFRTIHYGFCLLIDRYYWIQALYLNAINNRQTLLKLLSIDGSERGLVLWAFVMVHLKFRLSLTSLILRKTKCQLRILQWWAIYFISRHSWVDRQDKKTASVGNNLHKGQSRPWHQIGLPRTITSSGYILKTLILFIFCQHRSYSADRNQSHNRIELGTGSMVILSSLLIQKWRKILVIRIGLPTSRPRSTTELAGNIVYFARSDQGDRRQT